MQRKALGSLELELLLEAMNQPPDVALGTQPRSSGRAASDLNHQAFFLALRLCMFLTTLCSYVFVCGYVCAKAHMERSRDSLRKSVLFLPPRESRAWNSGYWLVVGLSADVYPLSHLPDPSFDLLMASEEESLGLGAEWNSVRRARKFYSSYRKFVCVCVVHTYPF